MRQKYRPVRRPTLRAQKVPRPLHRKRPQSYSGTEVFVVDDASFDRPREIIQSYWKHVVPVPQERNGGKAPLLILGSEPAKVMGALPDADDRLYPHAVARVVVALSPGVARVQFRLHLVNREDRQINLLPPVSRIP
jgi:glycosyltransferase involved in cell wall biosynthesis